MSGFRGRASHFEAAGVFLIGELLLKHKFDIARIVTRKTKNESEPPQTESEPHLSHSQRQPRYERSHTGFMTRYSSDYNTWFNLTVPAKIAADEDHDRSTRTNPTVTDHARARLADQGAFSETYYVARALRAR
eukprot:CAMPEP_0113681352 /NCGR_PEP_ID=MMETSP0038_2-20120614/11938_1 /TAXON_ID=2898 /ORGANISM="Cryptomonas paramecium" /LENGTH=132 /DNA_ID=CAMNT_0000600057 /DNA_START=336 /DNA_END=734 /DNA_ORIENTATION=+ /assembly_acc=CAM_ASM_000170